MTAVHLLLVAAGFGLCWIAVPHPMPTAGQIPARPRTRRRRTDPLDIARLAERLATVISGGSTPRHAWDAVASTLEAGELQDLARSVARGADPRTAARGRLAGSAPVRSLAVALTVCERTGAPTVTVLQGLASALRDLHDAALARTSAFAGPRSTARILLVLPLAGLALGMLVGADPLAFLLGTPGGRVAAIAGAALTAWGWVWMRRMLRAADPPVRDEVDPSVVLELTAGALRGGLPLSHAVQAVASALPGPAMSGSSREPIAVTSPTGARWRSDAAALSSFGAALAAGVPPDAAGSALPNRFAALRECAILAARSGADLVQVLQAAAQDGRRSRARLAEANAARLAVRLVLPTGLALLPAFIALGIVPTVASLLGGSFSADLWGSP